MPICCLCVQSTKHLKATSLTATCNSWSMLPSNQKDIVPSAILVSIRTVRLIGTQTLLQFKGDFTCLQCRAKTNLPFQAWVSSAAQHHVDSMLVSGAGWKGIVTVIGQYHWCPEYLFAVLYLLHQQVVTASQSIQLDTMLPTSNHCHFAPRSKLLIPVEGGKQ